MRYTVMTLNGRAKHWYIDRCDDCGAVICSRTAHDSWHRLVDRVIDDRTDDVGTRPPGVGVRPARLADDDADTPTPGPRALGDLETTTPVFWSAVVSHPEPCRHFLSESSDLRPDRGDPGR